MPNKKDGCSKLIKLGWQHDGLWWISPHSGQRYMRKEALDIEDLRKWGNSESAILGDKDHSMWVLAEERDNALTTMEELSKACQKRKLLSDRATASNLKGAGTD